VGRRQDPGATAARTLLEFAFTNLPPYPPPYQPVQRYACARPELCDLLCASLLDLARAGGNLDVQLAHWETAAAHRLGPPSCVTRPSASAVYMLQVLAMVPRLLFTGFLC
jgi:hypothetical protein